MSAAWGRLERYARWRRNMSLSRLPPDALQHVFSFLAFDDRCALLRAIVGHTPNIDVPRDVHAVAPEVRALYVRDTLERRFRDALLALAEQALYHCFSCDCAYAVVDWSPYGSRAFRPVAHYAWNHFPKPSCLVGFDEVGVRAHVRRCMRRNLPAVRVTLHLQRRCGTVSFVDYMPRVVQLLQLYAPTVILCDRGRIRLPERSGAPA